ncbi:modification methylase HhaI [Rickettsia felis str. Pedreira]|uniref:Modification methylase HhaI n=2 Tax=Rickettsia felis TaxID=42862 RepID=A0A0F3MR65_RICFI|nr:Site-specific DNA methylase [Rickettsia felis URRWXCal2]KJV58141.1 modification methylase HhaI [Rickettsia felis str. Pedreira]
MLNASLFGVPQARERVYFVCLRKDFSSEYILKYVKPKESYERIFLGDILEKEVDKSLYINRDDIVLDKTPVEKQLKPIRIGQVNKGGQGERIYSPFGHSITLSAFGGGVGARTGLYYINDKIRRLSINECKYLMGFPQDHYVADGLKGYRQLGNSVIPQIIANIYDSIIAV